MRLLRRFVLVASTCVLGSLIAHSGGAPQPELKTAAVAAFKNGLAFIVKQGDVHLENGVGNLEPIPNATLGSLWIAPNDAGASLDEVVARRYMVAAPQNLTTIAEILLANTGKMVTVVDSAQKEYTGEIVGLRQDAKREPESQSPSDSNVVPIEPKPRIAPDFLLLKSDGKLLALYFRNIARVTLPPDPILQQQQEEERKALRFRVKGATGHANLTVGYLEHGLGWTPSYLISLQDDTKAHITMQAVVVNDAEDLRDTDLFFVVGVPNFAYSNIPSPMALQQSLLEFMQAASRRSEGIAGPYSNALAGQAISEKAYFDVTAAPSFATTTEELQGVQEEDLFLYTRRNATLARGERATYNVFSEAVNYEHIYEWNLEDQLRVDGFGNPQNNASDRSTKDNIWHSLRLKNSTKFPWTSAPTMVISGTKPLSQDTIPYTPKGATSNLKLTIATDIRASHEENEAERQKNVERRHNYNYDQVTIEGKLKIKNYKTKDVKLSISNRVRGTVESQTADGKNEKLAEAIAVDNPLSRLTWEVTLKAGEERIIKYRYKVWLRG